MKIILAMSVIALCVGGCDALVGSSRTADGGVFDAPERVSLDGATLLLQTYMWRDFMPPAPDDGKPLTAILLIETSDHSPLPATITTDSLWVIHGDDVWATTFEDEETPPDMRREYRLVRVARNGPKFGPGVAVNVVVQVSGAGGQAKYLSAREQMIGRTD